MNAIEEVRQGAASVAAYYDALTTLLMHAEAKAGPGFDRGWNCTMLAYAVAYLYYQHHGEYYSCLEASTLRSSLREIADIVFEAMGHDGPAQVLRRRRLEEDDDA